MVTRIYIMLCFLAAILPGLPVIPSVAEPLADDFPGWPQTFQGKTIHDLPLTEKEKAFYANFPGKVRRFSDGQREVIIRWVRTESRKFHSAGDCFKGLGYSVMPLDLFVDYSGNTWGQFEASGPDANLLVRERISDGYGNQWTDVSAWYWDALLGKSTGPWWSITVAERKP